MFFKFFVCLNFGRHVQVYNLAKESKFLLQHGARHYFADHRIAVNLSNSIGPAIFIEFPSIVFVVILKPFTVVRETEKSRKAWSSVSRDNE